MKRSIAAPEPFAPASNQDGSGKPARLRDEKQPTWWRTLKLAPSQHIRYSEVWQGALAATLALWLGQRLFLYYAANHANFDALYGALGGIVPFLLLLYLSSSLVVFGICLCAARKEVREQANRHPERTPNDDAGTT